MHFRDVDVDGPPLAPSLEVAGGYVVERLQFRRILLQIRALVGVPLHVHNRAEDFAGFHIALTVKLYLEAQRLALFGETERVVLKAVRSEHHAGALWNVECRPPVARDFVDFRVRGDGGGGVGDVDPQILAVEADCVVRVVRPRVVDCVGDPRNPHALFVRRRRKRLCRALRAQAPAERIRIPCDFPDFRLQKNLVGVLWSLSHADFLHQLGFVRFSQSHSLDFRHVDRILRKNLPLLQPLDELGPNLLGVFLLEILLLHRLDFAFAPWNEHDFSVRNRLHKLELVRSLQGEEKPPRLHALQLPLHQIHKLKEFDRSRSSRIVAQEKLVGLKNLGLSFGVGRQCRVGEIQHFIDERIYRA